ncbi:5-oxoprolinase subunit B family protein [Algoriphagus sediminis]|uniref:Allophanate hydrolase subunit 1 n=1 Tax=Algoriphagus sediminis TaxID=3057113 RepID=A0ABT7YB53_9BACT|nr:allophanate hydrolase subunit 1 [Algoriphagus sediminis]MDN3203748.1 allophanate hydrolase subunit 1 [Algoriphagus sediminis]
MKYKLNLVGKNFTEITFLEEISNELLNKKTSILNLIQSSFSEEIKDIRTGFKTICIQWANDPSNGELKRVLKNHHPSNHPIHHNIWQIPVCYDPQLAPDLESFARLKNISNSEVIRLHTSSDYKLHFFGFLPGFMYLSGLDPRLFCPRKKVPDLSIPKGSVAIGGNQTGIYPSSSPGGWHVIGRSPISFFEAKSENPVWAKPGDSIRFKAISKEELEELNSGEAKPTLL